MNFDQEILKVQDTLVVMSGVQRRQAEVRKIHAEELDAMQEQRLEGYASRKAHGPHRVEPRRIADKGD
ncbi:MAG TPA: hypothetical protein VMB85_17825 [Bryobacteraceae bacterium]|nr:hypothetical protein [Bryobacteraceae bacterium]